MEDVSWGCETLCWNQAVFQAVVDVVVNLQFNLIEALWQTFWRTMPLEQRKSVPVSYTHLTLPTIRSV